MAQPVGDHELLGRYARDRDEGAFGDLRRRYVSLVYSSAARRVGDRHLAEDVTQAVFMILSRKAGSIAGDKPLSLWLLNATRYAAANALKIEARRRRHEEAAGAGGVTAAGVCSADPAAALVWQEVASQLDDAVLKLPSVDRRVVLLRYFEGRPIRDIAVALNMTEGAIKQRLSRAVEKLRTRLDRVAGGALAAIPAARFEALLASQVVLPAPAGVVVGAVTSGVAMSSSAMAPHIVKGAMSMMNWTKAKVVVAVVAAVTIGGAGGVVTLDRAFAQSNPKPPAARPNKPPQKANGAADKEKGKKADNYLGIVTVADAPPVVVETFPKSGAADVDPATTELKVTFSKEMQDGSWSWAQISDGTFPNITSKPHYQEDRRTCVLPVKLEPNHTYVIQLNYPPFENFVDTDGRKAVRYLFVFQTRE